MKKLLNTMLINNNKNNTYIYKQTNYNFNNNSIYKNYTSYFNISTNKLICHSLSYTDETNIDNHLIENGILFCTGEISDNLSNSLINEFLFITNTTNTTSIKLLINSPGGSIMSGMSIYDIISCLNLSTSTISMGLAASMGAFLLAVGENNMRYSFPNTRIMIHQPIGGIQGVAIDVEIQVIVLIIDKRITLSS